jgi:YesN/AraC family two-component response regulator
MPIELFFQQRTGVYQLPAHLLERVTQILYSIYDDSLMTETYYSELARLKTLELLLILSNHLNELEGDQQAHSAQRAVIQPVMAYIRENLSQQLSLQQLAQHFYLNRTYLARTFKAVTGQTVHQYLNNQRIRQSQRLLLLYPNYRIQEIAGLCGFTSSSYYIDQFKKVASMTPKQYRMRHGQPMKRESPQN